MTTVSELISRRVSNTITNTQTWGGILYNVKAFGATGDGATNDTAAIQDTIDTALTNNGKAVFFPPGTYKVTTLSDLSSVVLFGDNASFSGISNTINQIGEVGTDEIVTSMILNGAVTEPKLATNSVTTTKIKDKAVTNAKLADDVKVGSLAALNTTDKSSVVAAVNSHLADGAPHTGHMDVDGSKAMTGNLEIRNGTPTVALVNTAKSGENRAWIREDINGRITMRSLASAGVAVRNNIDNADLFTVDNDGNIGIKRAILFGFVGLNPQIKFGSSHPEGNVSAPEGSLYLRAVNGANALYVKESGSGNTGWVKK